MSNIYTAAPEVEAIARELVREHHTHLTACGAKVEYFFCSKTPTKNGQEVWGTARKIGSLAAFLDGRHESADEAEANAPFFVIVIAEPVWRTLSNAQRQALVDHELLHLWAEEDEETLEVKLSIRGHDFEGFVAEINRHGLWRDTAKAIGQAIEEAQGRLPLEMPPVGSNGSAARRLENSLRDLKRKGVTVEVS